jgi:hypothetical protein
MQPEADAGANRSRFGFSFWFADEGIHPPAAVSPPMPRPLVLAQILGIVKPAGAKTRVLANVRRFLRQFDLLPIPRLLAAALPYSPS